jgi:hypothetical protein
MPKTITVPASLAELLGDPQRVADAIALVSALGQLEVHLVPPGNARTLAPGNKAIVGDPPNLILPLPLKFRGPIPDCTDVPASIGATVRAIQAELRANSQLPS